MSPEAFQVLFVVFAVWSSAVVAKAVKAVTTKQAYTFSMWDGGMIRAGKSLTRTGAIVKIVTSSAMALSAVCFASGVMPLTEARNLVIGCAIASIVCDFAMTERA